MLRNCDALLGFGSYNCEEQFADRRDSNSNNKNGKGRVFSEYMITLFGESCFKPDDLAKTQTVGSYCFP